MNLQKKNLQIYLYSGEHNGTAETHSGHRRDRKISEYLVKTRGYQTVDIPSEFHSTWLDNDKAKFLMDWRPVYDLERLIDEAFDYQRAGDDPRIIWYPG